MRKTLIEGSFVFHMYFIRYVFTVCIFFLCVSSVNLGWPSPLALWPLWPFGSGCGLSICLLLPRSGGTGAMLDPPHPSLASPSPAPRPAAQAPESAQYCQVGPRTHSWTPSCTHTNTGQQHTNAHNSNTYA